MSVTNKKWLSRLSAIALIFVVLGGGLVIWDHYDYPIPRMSMQSEPFGESMNWPAPMNDFGTKVNAWRSTYLLEPKMMRVLKSQLRQLKFANTEWQYTDPQPDRDGSPFYTIQTGGPEGTIKFDQIGNVDISGVRFRRDIPNDELTRFERIDDFTLRLYGEKHQLNLRIQVIEADLTKINLIRKSSAIYTQLSKIKETAR